MKRTFQILAATALCVMALHAVAAEPSTMTVSDCWIRVLPGDLPSGGYFKLVNSGDKPVELTSVTTPAFGMAMLHQTQNNGSTSSMVMVDKVTVPANGTLAFKPGNYHVMLEKPKLAVKVGTSIPMDFTFSDGEKLTSQCAVKGAGAMSN